MLLCAKKEEGQRGGGEGRKEKRGRQGRDETCSAADLLTKTVLMHLQARSGATESSCKSNINNSSSSHVINSKPGGANSDRHLLEVCRDLYKRARNLDKAQLAAQVRIPLHIRKYVKLTHDTRIELTHAPPGLLL